MENINLKDREIRVFLSSTFRDMEYERNFLLKQVFPKIRAACFAREVGFTEIDLRWGITEEEAKNGNTVEICLSEIDRCRDFPPFFIGFLGERYGWIPQEAELASYWQSRADSPYRAVIEQAIRRGISVTELEMELAVLAEGADDKISGRALFLLRDKSLTDTLYQQDTGSLPDESDTRYYDSAAGLLDALKNRIRHTPYLAVDGYESVEAFGEQIEQFLMAQLDEFFPENEQPSELELSNQAQARFRYQRLQNFIPRPDISHQLLDALLKRLEKPALGPVLLAGPSGQGKSALLADMARTLEALDSNIHWWVIDHYVGADETGSLEGWLLRIFNRLHPYIHDLTGPIPESSKERLENFSSWLAMAARRKEHELDTKQAVRFVLILDAADQFLNQGEDVTLLTPELLGTDGLVIFSAADGTKASLKACDFERVTVTPFSQQQRIHLITDTLKRYRKTLPEPVFNKLASAPQCGSPLFLTLALEELRLDARHETLEQMIDSILESQDAGHLFLHRFLLDDDYIRENDPLLAVSFMALLGAVHQDLSEHQLSELLATQDDPLPDGSDRAKLPQIYLSKLLTSFQPFLLTKAGRKAQMHRILGESACCYIGEIPVRQEIFNYFYAQYKSHVTQDSWDSPQAVAEILFQLNQLIGIDIQNQAQWISQRIALLGDLFVCTRVCEFDPEVLEAALLSLSESEKDAIKTLWREEVASKNQTELSESTAGICGFAEWMYEKALDRYELSKVLLEFWLEQQEKHAYGTTQHADTLNLLVTILRKKGGGALVKNYIRLALSIREKVLGPQDADVAESLDNLAGYLKSTGSAEDFAEVRGLYERALLIWEKAKGQDHPDVATSFNNLACFLISTGSAEDFAEARSLFERALAIYEKAKGPEHTGVAIGLNNLAFYLTSTGNAEDFAEARGLYERSLAIWEKAIGPTHPDIASGLNNLASYLDSTGDADDFLKARGLHELSLDIREKALGPDHPNVAFSLNNLALYLTSTGDADDFAVARGLYERALAVRGKALGPEHPDVATSLNNLANYLKSTGDADDFAAARGMYERALAICEKAQGSEHPDVATSLNNLANYLKSTGDADDFAAARGLYERALAIRGKALGPEHPDVALSLNNLAHYLKSTGDADDFATVRGLYERALAIREKVYGHNHSETIASVVSLAQYLVELNRSEDYATISQYYDDAVHVLEQERGQFDGETLRVMQNYAVFLRNTDNLEQSVQLFTELLTRNVECFGNESLNSASAYSGFGSLLAKKGDLNLAREYLNKALQIRKKELGSEHELTKLIEERFSQINESNN